MTGVGEMPPGPAGRWAPGPSAPVGSPGLTPGPTALSRGRWRVVRSAAALVVVALTLGVLLAVVLGGAVYGISALLRHLASGG